MADPRKNSMIRMMITLFVFAFFILSHSNVITSIMKLRRAIA